MQYENFCITNKIKNFSKMSFLFQMALFALCAKLTNKTEIVLMHKIRISTNVKVKVNTEIISTKLPVRYLTLRRGKMIQQSSNKRSKNKIFRV